MASTEKRWLTASTSKLAKADLPIILRKEAAWQALPAETRQHLYSLLPAPVEGEEPHDINIHPLKTQYKSYIDEELRRWQEDLREGKETKKWREEAMKAGSDRTQGKWDEWKAQERESTWGQQAENAPVQADEAMDVDAKSAQDITRCEDQSV